MVSERADLAEQKAKLVEEVLELSGMLKELEDTLLYELANSTGNILDNTDLIETLEKTKTKAVRSRSSRRRRHLRRSTSRCAAYRPVAKRGSILFFVMSLLSTLNNMYELSLALYSCLPQSLERAEPDRWSRTAGEHHHDADARLLQLHVPRHLRDPQAHVLAADDAAHHGGEGTLDRTQLDFFLKGNLSPRSARTLRPAIGSSDSGWHDMQRLGSLSRTPSPTSSPTFGANVPDVEGVVRPRRT